MMDTKQKSGSTIVEQPQIALKRSLRVARAKTADVEVAAEDVVLIQEEERILDDEILIHDEERIMDEEITSEEESQVADEIERKLVAVALVKSVVETATGGRGSKKSPSGLSNNPPTSRYGLRKRRRPSGEDLKLLEQKQSINKCRAERTRPNGRHKGSSVESSPSTHDSITYESIGCEGTSRSRRRPRPRGRKTASLDEPIPSKPSPSLVPNPLASAPATPPQQSLTNPHSLVPDETKLALAVSCPLSTSAVASAHDKKSESPDPSPGLEHLVDKRKVTISEPARLRGFSIDLDSVGFDFPEESATAEVEGRGRAFSFECFAFGINAVEPLPPLQDSSDIFTGRPRQDSLITIEDQSGRPRGDSLDHPGRPRGDSIIFDPSSFQDGGIHERSALETAAAPSPSVPELVQSSSNTCWQRPNTETSCTLPSTFEKLGAATGKPTHSFSESSGLPVLPAVTSYTATTTTTTNSSTTTTVTITAASNTVSLSMELLNKDGRIGIYLPEARKARIARFHAKRARRIWRKRIKYDCRKKLADSRPRIKGRFVKRSDMEEE